MGVNYSQSCILGVDLDYDCCIVIDQEEKFEMQPRYNTITGEVDKMEKVIIQEEQYHFSLFGVQAECFYMLVEGIAEKFDLDFALGYGHKTAAVGIKIGEEVDFGRVDLIEGFESMDSLMEDYEKIKKVFGEGSGEIGLVFLSDVG